MNPVPTSLTAHAESMTVIVLILLVAARKVIQLLSKRQFPSHLTLQTDSFGLHLQTKQHLSQQESPQQEEQGDDEDGRSENDNGGISPINQRTKW